MTQGVGVGLGVGAGFGVAAIAGGVAAALGARAPAWYVPSAKIIVIALAAMIDPTYFMLTSVRNER
jgi:hypothetical protein